jgi:hypothetical protein
VVITAITPIIIGFLRGEKGGRRGVGGGDNRGKEGRQVEKELGGGKRIWWREQRLERRRAMECMNKRADGGGRRISITTIQKITPNIFISKLHFQRDEWLQRCAFRSGWNVDIFQGRDRQMHKRYTGTF